MGTLKDLLLGNLLLVSYLKWPSAVSEDFDDEFIFLFIFYSQNRLKCSSRIAPLTHFKCLNESANSLIM